MLTYYGIDWLGMCCTVLGVYLLGKGQKHLAVGFFVCCVGGILWIVFGILSRNVPLIVVNIFLVILQAKGFLYWAKVLRRSR